MNKDNIQLFFVTEGLATLGPELVKVINLLEACFLKWAIEWNADQMIFPPLLRIKELERLDYFRNFPHLGIFTSHLQGKVIDDYVTESNIQNIPSSHLASSEYILPSAACYNIYLYLSNNILQNPKNITTVAQCFRNESHYNELARLLSFTLREIVCVGSVEAVELHLARSKESLLDFASAIGLPLEIKTATDSFYDPQSDRAKMQKIFPVKEEFIYNDTVSIASLNFHRNFFGERCNIRTADESYAFSGCIGMGLERWVYALMDKFNNDFNSIYDRLRNYQEC
jgi:seryl-tRNA synthetase